MFGWLFGSTYNKISTMELKQTYLKDKKEKFFLDVRTPGEFKGRSISGFKNISLQTLSGKLSQIPKNKEIVVICQSGGRSAMACRMLKKAGYDRVTNVKGGMSAWR
ncbi:rhodanese-like domain-containing protein [Priestia koreensis]|uniref:rhodanese-like domain-containing protein n=1 Tax=Priestia koreensis TaxID=284581 RepID=UPI0034587024